MSTVTISELVSLEGHRAIVTGGAMGIGRGIALRLAQAGASVLIADVDGESASRTADELGAMDLDVQSVVADVSDEATVTAMCEQVRERLGGVDILVNNAGIFPASPIDSMTVADFDSVIGINLRGTFLCTKHASALMVEQGRGGRIINITSIDALHPSMVGLAHYDASKHGMWGFTKTSALELAPHGIWVNAIAPGGIATPGVAAMQEAGAVGHAPDPAVAIEAFLAGIPMGRMGEPDDIAKVALFLASDLSSYMTGAQVVVDGGALLT
jgi:2-deoxy-D-gluconate 3-dehydrogenase